jgi:hypothetical protein
MVKIPIKMPIGRKESFLVAIHSTSAENAVPLQLMKICPDQLVDARFVSPSMIELEFVDGLRRSLAIGLLGMPVDRINWPTLKASVDGTKVIVNGIKGDPVTIDAATLRYLVDEKYAAKMDAKLKSLQFTEEELERMVQDNPPPPEWFSQPSRDLTRKSWK